MHLETCAWRHHLIYQCLTTVSVLWTILRSPRHAEPCCWTWFLHPLPTPVEANKSRAEGIRLQLQQEAPAIYSSQQQTCLCKASRKGFWYWIWHYIFRVIKPQAMRVLESSTVLIVVYVPKCVHIIHVNLFLCERLCVIAKDKAHGFGLDNTFSRQMSH